MALLWGDGFDQYGTNQAIALSNGYSAFAANSISTVNPRTGLYSVLFTSLNFSYFRRILDASTPTVGVGIGFRANATPSGNAMGIRFETAGGTALVRIALNPELRIVAYSGNTATVLGQSPANAINLSAWQHIEAKLIRSATVGYIEVRIDGILSFIVAGLNLGATDCNAVSFGNPNSGAGGNINMQVDDFVIWDGTGATNNDFLGDRRCFTSFLTADTAFADWVPSTGLTGFNRINASPPVDTSYIEGLAPGAISEFQKTAIGIASSNIAGIIVVSRHQKTDAGTSTIRLGIHSGAFVSNGPEIVPATSFSYQRQIFELDPNGSVPWTKAAADAATIRITREA